MDIRGILARDIGYYTDLANQHQGEFAHAKPGSGDKERHRQCFVLAVQVYSALSRYKVALMEASANG